MPNHQRIPFFAAAHFFISAILFRVRNPIRLLTFLSVASVFVLNATPHSGLRTGLAAVQSSPQQVQAPSNVPPQQGVPQQAAPAQATPQSPAQPPAQSPAHSGPVVVLDPAHGGTDSGARGQSGVIEKDMVLLVARTAKFALEREGFRVVMTRNDDSNPSYDDRAATANAYRDAIFISFHISSTGTPNTARVYSYQFSETGMNASAITANANSLPITPVKTTSLLAWEEAQRPYVGTSHRLADSLQADVTLRFAGSPGVSSAVAVRGLRSVAGPAVAIELSNVAVTDPNQLVAMAAPLATAIVHTVSASRGAGGASGNPGAR
jgi:N-acetylmuramoyl-L-alanine amidase